ncbi:protein kinase [Streptomyces sp. NBC_00878]|uniref:protein kinase domain-containing protein n=1 Tax=Streptomyces sp. NBC_00878 TaxID=2975854 RepID=UPI002251B2A1|nr:protein kinase [Streptomyces sp. NBC_00878]MCX4906000.1 protein kinase [Streptomyces sp. NBC_00878]
MSGAASDAPNGRSYAVSVPKGYRVGPWEVREPIASGAFGSVYAARRAGGGGGDRGGAGDGDVAGARTTQQAGKGAGKRSRKGAGERAGKGAGDGAAEKTVAVGGSAVVGSAVADGGTGPLPRHAALKFLPTGTRTPRQLHHLRELADREQELLKRLRSPRLIRMYEALTVDDPEHPELDGATVLVLERAEGSMDALLDRSATPGSGPALLAQVCEGLHQLHHAGWVHGDLKPANILLMKDGSARLGDFNLAAELEGTHAYSPAFSTPDYTPPELLWAEIGVRGQQIRPTADIWAFGVLAHLVLTGSLPLPGATAEARRDAVVRYARGTDELRLSPELPPDWREIITDCLAPTHAERAPYDAASLLRRVEQVAGTARSARLPRLRPRRWRRPVLAAAVAVAVLSAATVTVTYALRDSDTVVAAPPTCEKPAVYEDSTYGRGYTAGWSGTWDFAIKQGEGGSQVRELQCLLKHLHGFTGIGVDGEFGPLTDAAVVAFQKREGLSADGEVGPNTWRALRTRD